MSTLISHFYNEEYLLPWWLKHHRNMFDHGIMIDYASTDRSVAIIKELVPTWDIIAPSNPFTLDGINLEVEDIEATIDGWKMALNTTEFLCGDLAALESYLASDQKRGARVRPIIMVDLPEMLNVEPDKGLALATQRHHGFLTSNTHLAWHDFAEFGAGWDYRARLFHNHTRGLYGTGRHWTIHDDILGGRHGGPEGYPPDIAVLWFGFAPWTPEFRARKRQIKREHDPTDLTDAVLDWCWQQEIPGVIDLSTVPEFNVAIDTWRSTYA